MFHNFNTASKDVLTIFPDLEIIKNNKELFDELAHFILFSPLPKERIYDPDNYFTSLGHIIGFFSEFLENMEKNGWKKQ